MRQVRWGILGTGNICSGFAGMLGNLENAAPQAVGSRSEETAAAFAAKYGVPTAYGSYEAVLDDPAVDAVYIGTPNSLHYPLAMEALRRGKHVLCEKAFALNRAQAAGMIALAREKGLFLMEAYKSKFFPLVCQVMELVESGALGEIVTVRADYGKILSGARRARVQDKELGGGTLLNLGVYALNMVCMVLGYHPAELTGFSTYNEFGTDDAHTLLLHYENGATGQVFTSSSVQTSCGAEIFGTKGRVALERFWLCPRATVAIDGQEPYTLTQDFARGDLSWECEHVSALILEGKTESPVMTHEMTLAIMEMLDATRAKMGLRYPQEG